MHLGQVSAEAGHPRVRRKNHPLYDKYYTLDDLKAINAFYASPTGQKVLTSLPQIMQESMKIGQEWGAKIGAQAEEEIKQEKANN